MQLTCEARGLYKSDQSNLAYSLEENVASALPVGASTGPSYIQIVVKGHENYLCRSQA